MGVRGGKRIGKPDAPLPVDCQIVGRVDELAVYPVRKRRDGLAVFLKARNTPPAALAAVQVTLQVKAKAIGQVGAGEVLGHLLRFRVEAKDTVGFDMGEQDRVTIPDGPLRGAVERAGNQLKLPA